MLPGPVPDSYGPSTRYSVIAPSPARLQPVQTSRRIARRRRPAGQSVKTSQLPPAIATPAKPSQ